MINFSYFNSVIAVIKYFHNEETCKNALAEARWGDDASYRFADMFSKACRVFAYTDVLSLSSVIDVNAWKAKHDSYYWVGKVA